MPNIWSSIGHDQPEHADAQRVLLGRSGRRDAPITNGISEMWVIAVLVHHRQKRLVDHFGISTAVAPTPSTEKSDQLCAFTWKNGR